ncbi:AAA-ATPase ASD, mitochondrial-like isoform X2 [Gastrolobium bilobum]|uniref:AAA-ATPase ASD, mitochondrial-like isoform X2 n=1 Tax=Gastrolobium bilobum TaxID=150636 RepID=UPI002AB297A9|nr:AAA-ATPase ASD, mitochondrial-like isoform X2 [Gastrolobium bilobum]
MMGIGQIWSQLGSIMASIMFVYAMFEKFFPSHLRIYVSKYTQKFTGLIYPYIKIKFPEFSGERLKRSEAYSAIQTYLSANSSQSAKKLKAEVVKDSQTPLVLSMDDNEEINDEFQGEGKNIALKNRQLKLYTNNPSNNWYGYKSTKWSHITFEHPARFETLAMDPKKKEEIINDLVKFRNGKDYYAKIGKAWKRGYLLYGPPGTGKSTMIAAMANFMNYDVYDLELTAVKENTDLRKLLIETSSKSIIVIEDIDCSLDLTGQRKKKKEKDEEDGEVPKNPTKKDEEEENKGSKVTLSGLLNFIDGIWSACGGERIIIFTTNFVEKLDPALIRRGRMDKHIELSYCCYEAFKVLANNYLDVESHSLFPTIEKLLGETNMTPADVAENLMPKSIIEDSEICLKNLIDSLEKAKEEAKKKAEDEEAQLKAEKEKEQMGEEEEVKANGKSKEEVKENGKSKEEVKENGTIQ